VVIHFLGFPGNLVDKINAFQESIKLECPNYGFSVSSSASIALTPGWLFTVAPHFFQEFLQLFQDEDRAVDVRGKFGHEPALELLAFRVAPVIFGFVPLKRDVPRQSDQPAFVPAHAHW
jgi:hypothetical protein